MKNPAELFLILKKEFFLEILNGKKTEEYRDFTDYYIDRLCEFDKDGQCIGVKKI